jgi:hypothetical protein
LTTLQILVMICVLVLSILFIVQCFLNVGKQRRGIADGAEEGLLSGYPDGQRPVHRPLQGFGVPAYPYGPGFFPSPYGAPYPMAQPPAYFAQGPVQPLDPSQ